MSLIDPLPPTGGRNPRTTRPPADGAHARSRRARRVPAHRARRAAGAGRAHRAGPGRPAHAPARSCGSRWRDWSPSRCCSSCRPGPAAGWWWRCGVVLGLLTVLKLLDMGFFVALDRPFDVVLDWAFFDDGVRLPHRLGRPGAVRSPPRSAVVLARRRAARPAHAVGAAAGPARGPAPHRHGPRRRGPGGALAGLRRVRGAARSRRPGRRPAGDHAGRRARRPGARRAAGPRGVRRARPPPTRSATSPATSC